MSFAADGGVYTLSVGDPDYAEVRFDLLRTERSGELTGEVSVWSGEEGRHLHTARLNLSSTRSRSELARYLLSRTNGHSPDWAAIVESACVATITAYRRGEPAILLRDAPDLPAEPDVLPPLLADHLPTMLFGDGGSAKSLLALAAGLSLQSGEPFLPGLTPTGRRRVLYLDWEMDARTHRSRMLGLTGEDAPDLAYLPCRSPLVEEQHRIARVIREQRIEYLIVDSVGFACDGPPEASDVALRFMGAVRQLDRGALLIAHTNRAQDDQRPFGSNFWHHSARRTWYADKQQDLGADGLAVGLFNRKNNVGRLAAPLSFEVRFDGPRITLARGADVREVAGLADHTTARERVRHALAKGALTYPELADRTGETPEALRALFHRDRGRSFVTLDETPKRFGLVDARYVTSHDA